MAYRTRKQIIIVLVFFFLLALIGAGVYYVFLRPAANCFDGIKNQDEEDIDCGGQICESCQIRFLKPAEVVWAKAIAQGQNSYDLVGKIKNINSNFGTGYLKYIFVLKNSNGQIVGQKEGTSFILPNSEKYLIENNVQAKEAIDSVTLTLDSGDLASWQKLENYQAINLFVQDKNFSITTEPNFLAEAKGVLKNNTYFTFDRVVVNVVLYDGSGNPIGASQSQINTLTANEGRYFSTRWSVPFSGEVKSFDMQAQTNLFSVDNYMKEQGEGGGGY